MTGRLIALAVLGSLLLTAAPQTARAAYTSAIGDGYNVVDPISAAGSSPNFPGNFSSADLAGGSLRAVAVSGPLPSVNNFEISNNSYFTDWLHITGAITGAATAMIHLHLDGTLIPSSQEVADASPAPGLRFATAAANFYFGAASGAIAYDTVFGDLLSVQSITTLLNNSLHGDATCNSVSVDNGRGQDVTDCQIGAGHYDLNYYIPLTLSDTDRDITFESALYARAAGGGQSLFGQTAQLSLDLPAGLSFTSQSGVFLSNAPGSPTAVPEPASFGLFLAGLLSLVGLRRLHGPAGVAA